MEAIFQAVWLPCAILVIVFLFLRYLADSKINFSIQNGKVSLSAPPYSFQFDASDIQDMWRLPAMPTGFRINGYSVGAKSAGRFRLEGIGPCHVFVSAKFQPLLLIQLKNDIVLIGGESTQQTEKWEDCLKDALHS